MFPDKPAMKLLILALLFSLSPPAAAEEDSLAEDAQFKYEGRDNGIGLLINDWIAEQNKLKTADQIEKYHACLLSGKKEARQGQDYLSSYRYLIAAASESFNVPIAMLTCLCGRESRFDARASSDHSDARGICQALGASLADVNRWRTTIPGLRRDWEDYVQRIRARLEHPSCASAPVTHETLMRCPSLGLGVASLYLKFAYARVEKARFGDGSWDASSLPTLTTVAGAYFAGPGLASKALAKTRNRAAWHRALMSEVCFDAKDKGKTREWTHTRLSQLRNHMSSVRNCMQADNWLDHQGQPLKGECAMATSHAAQQLQALEKFRGSIPVTCEGW